MSAEEKWDWYYGDKFNESKPITLQDRIDSIFSTRPKGSNRQERINKAIQELREQIKALPSLSNDSVNDVLELIGEK